MNLSPRRISASFSGRNRHITLMLHSAGSAISAGGREGAQGWVGGRGLAQRGKVVENHTARNKAASRSLDDASQQVIANSAGWAAPAAPTPCSGQPINLWPSRLQTCLSWPCAAPQAHLPTTTRRADEAMRREPASPYSDLPGSCELSHPASAPARSVASPTRPVAPPCLGTALVGYVTAGIRPALAQAPRAKHPGTCSRFTCG